VDRKTYVDVSEIVTFSGKQQTRQATSRFLGALYKLCALLRQTDIFKIKAVQQET
jgi:hypothetical protein